MSALNHQESVRAYVEDYECLLKGIDCFINLEKQVVQDGNIQAIRRHYDLHPEDKLCSIYRPGTRDTVMCRRSGIDAINRIALRLVGEAPNGCDLSSSRISEIISEQILQVAIDDVTDDEELVTILKSYVVLSEAEHTGACYHFPCILLHLGPAMARDLPPSPDEIVLGPVTFRRLPVFLRMVNSAIEKGEKHTDDKALELFVKQGEKHGWVASVEIPCCAPDVSRRRAEEIVEAAINLLKIFIGLRHGKSMRLPHTAPSRNRETCVLTEVGSEIEWRWEGKRLEGALVAGDPLAGVPDIFRSYASQLLTLSLGGERPEATNRLVDALKWFGDASFEDSGGVQIVKLIAALERLTTTERLSGNLTHVFCKRVAYLASVFGRDDLEKAYRDTRKAYQLRSDVMHGSRSQSDAQLRIDVGLVHDLTRAAIYAFLAVHDHLANVIKDSRLASITEFYELKALPFESRFDQLRAEFKYKK